MTGKLWNEKDYVVPSPPDPKLALSQTSLGILAQYNASYERNGQVRRLAYLVEPNMERVGEGKKPVFVDPAKAGRPMVIPILSPPAAGEKRPDLYAVYWTNTFAFSIFCQGKEVLGPCGLPAFRDQRQKAEQLALTPLAVAGDASIVGACAGAVVGVVWGLGRAGYTGDIVPTGYSENSGFSDPH
jgi:hypothetical protein